jgi:hypothetical protein
MFLIVFFLISSRFGRVQSVKILGKKGEDESGGGAATVAFMDIKSANIAFNAEHKFEDRVLRTNYYDPSAFEGGGQSVQSASAASLATSRLHQEDTASTGPSVGVQSRLLAEEHYDSPIRSSHGGYSVGGVREFAYRTPGTRYPEDGYGTPRQRLVRTTGYRTQGGYTQDK